MALESPIDDGVPLEGRRASGLGTEIDQARAALLHHASISHERERPLVLLAAFLLALGVHGGFAVGTRGAAMQKREQRVEMALYRPPPPPAPPPAPEEKAPEPPPPKKLKPPRLAEIPPPPPSNQEPPPDAPPEVVPVVTGISMSSTVQGSSGPQVRVGNTTYGNPDKEPRVALGDVKPYAGGVPGFKAERASTITREGEILSSVAARYPKELADLGIEGAAVLLIEITKDGVVHDVKLVKSTGNAKLDALAIEAMKRAKVRPAERNGEKVDSVLRHTYRFEVYD